MLECPVKGPIGKISNLPCYLKNKQKQKKKERQKAQAPNVCKNGSSGNRVNSNNGSETKIRIRTDYSKHQAISLLLVVTAEFLEPFK